MDLHLTPDVLIVVNSALAGVTVFGGLACLSIWLYDRALRGFLWASALALMMTLTLLCGTGVIALHGNGSTATAVFLRSVAYGSCTVLAVRAIGYLVPGLALRWISRALVAVLVVRAALWWPTELFVRAQPDAAGWPRYGPLTWTAGLYTLGLLAAGVLAYPRTGHRVRLVIIACGLSVVLLNIAPLAMAQGSGLEEMLTLSVLPGGVAVLFLAGRALLRNARGHDTLTRRQTILLELSQAAMSVPVDTLRHHIERRLKTELKRDVVVAVSGPDRFPQPGTSVSTIRVAGRRQCAVVRGLGPMSAPTRQFVEAVLGVLLAASERALGEADHAHAAGHDQLTGLLTLAALTERMHDHLGAGDTVGGASRVALLLCRVDGLGQLAAVDGPERMNALLAGVADGLRGLRRSRTVVARVTTDVFGIVDDVPPDETDAFLTCRMRELRATVACAAPAAHLTIGVAVAAADASPSSLFSDASVALERARVGGDAVFDDAIGADVRAEAVLERDLRQAVARDEIEVHYQPVATAVGRTIVAYEALARWRHLGSIRTPGVWVPAAERLGLIGEIDRRVLTIAARDQARLGVPVAVNVSPLDLARDTFVADVLNAIGDCPPGQIILEITESAVMADLTRSVAVLQELRARGIRIALDDFGSSYSSLAALADLPVDILKLDASFVARLDQTNGVAVVQAVIGLGRSLGKPIVAEGIETEAQLSLLAMLGADRVQGYLIGRPAGVDPLAETVLAASPDEPAPRRLFVVGSVAEVR